MCYPNFAASESRSRGVLASYPCIYLSLPTYLPQIIKQTAKFIAESGLASKGYTYVNIDDCWQVARDPITGVIIADPVTFPSGIKALADYVHSYGLKLGIYR